MDHQLSERPYSQMVEVNSKMKQQDLLITRAALGDIGNRVSAMTIDSSKGGAIKKEILQPSEVMMNNPGLGLANNMPVGRSIPASCSNPNPVPHVVKDIVKTERVLVERVPDYHSLQPHKAGPAEDAFSNAVFMDISNDAAEEAQAYSKAFFPDEVEDIDADDKNNPQLVSIYVNSIYDYMRHMENKYSIQPNFLEGSELSGKMRAILIDWLSQVHCRFHLLQDTLYLTVSIVDRYLQIKPCSKARLQLVGVTAMLVASKYEEMFAPEVADFVYITDNTYTKADIRDMEQDILRTLDFSFGRPICLNFLRRNSKAAQVDVSKHTLAKYLMELAMVEYDMVSVKPSLVAAAALYLSMKLIDNSPWTETIKYYSSYAESDLLPTAKRLAQLVVKSETSKQVAVKTKYSSSKFMKITSLPQLKSQLLYDFAQRKEL